MAEDISFSVPNSNGDPVRVGAWRFAGDGQGPTVHLQAGVHADEIAGMVAYLASAEAAFVTGAGLKIDGGFAA